MTSLYIHDDRVQSFVSARHELTKTLVPRYGVNSCFVLCTVKAMKANKNIQQITLSGLITIPLYNSNNCTFNLLDTHGGDATFTLIGLSWTKNTNNGRCPLKRSRWSVINALADNGSPWCIQSRLKSPGKKKLSEHEMKAVVYFATLLFIENAVGELECVVLLRKCLGFYNL